MVRKADPKNSLWIVGNVRVTNPAPGRKGYRILWSEDGRQRERSAPNFERAKQIAIEEMTRMEAGGAVARGKEVAFGSLVLDHLRVKRSRWAPDWYAYKERIARLHVLPAVGALGHTQITLARLQRVLDELQTVDGRAVSWSHLDHVRKLLVASVKRGVALGLWEPHTHPAIGLHTPNVAGDDEDGAPDLTLIPTDHQVELLIKLAGDLHPKYGLMAAVAAYTGVRWGELLALTVDDFDFDNAQVKVGRNCQESADGYRFVPIHRKKGGPKPRLVYADPVIEDVAEWVAELPADEPVGDRIHGKTPPRRLFYTKTGNPISRSNHRVRFNKLYEQVPGWPEGATWHYLRHYAITRFLNMGIEPRFVSEMAGHGRNPSTTWNWYLGLDESAVSRNQEIYRGAMKR